jgi:hypothetical protein
MSSDSTAAIEKFNAQVRVAFEHFTAWTHGHVQNHLADLSQSDLSFRLDFKDDIETFSNWLPKKVWEDAENAFLPVLPAAKDNPQLAVFYNDLYSIMIAKRGAEAFDDVDASLSYTSGKWGVYSSRLIEPFVRYLSYFHQAINEATTDESSISRKEMEEAVWNRFIAPTRLLFERILRDEAQYERHAARAMLRGIYLLDRVQDGFLDKAHAQTWHKSFGEWWATAKDGIEMKKAVAAPIASAGIKNFDAMMASQGTEEKTGERISLLDFAFRKAADHRHDLSEFLVRDLLSTKAGLDRLKLPDWKKSASSAERARVVKDLRERIAKLQMDLDAFDSGMAVVESLTSSVTEESKTDEKDEESETEDEEEDDEGRKRERSTEEDDENIVKRSRIAGDSAFGCDFCQKPSKYTGGSHGYTCKHCKETSYCSKHCARQHWNGGHSVLHQK